MTKDIQQELVEALTKIAELEQLLERDGWRQEDGKWVKDRFSRDYVAARS